MTKLHGDVVYDTKPACVVVFVANRVKKNKALEKR